MAAQSFDRWLTFAIGASETDADPASAEGGWSDDPRDPGGATWRGITLTEWRKWRDDDTLTGADMRNLLRRSEIARIAFADYWRPIQGDALPIGVDVLLMDHAFNAGVAGTSRLLQRMLGVTADGRIGPITLLALRGAGTPVETLSRLHNVFEADYRSMRAFGTFGAGWIARLNRCTALARSLVSPAKQTLGIS